MADVAMAIAGAIAAAGMSALGAPGETPNVDVEGIAGASAMTVWRAPGVPGETWLPAVKQK